VQDIIAIVLFLEGIHQDVKEENLKPIKSDLLFAYV
jgi:hypothetical protein